MSWLASDIGFTRRRGLPGGLELRRSSGRRTKRGHAMSTMPGSYAAAEMKASDADRDAVLAVLSEHFQAGRLTSAELEDRTGRALAARTYGDLAALTADLPGPVPAPGPAAPPAPAGYQGRARLRPMLPVIGVL